MNSEFITAFKRLKREFKRSSLRCFFFGHKWGKLEGPYTSSMCIYKYRKCLRCEAGDKVVIDVFNNY